MPCWSRVAPLALAMVARQEVPGPESLCFAVGGGAARRCCYGNERDSSAGSDRPRGTRLARG